MEPRVLSTRPCLGEELGVTWGIEGFGIYGGSSLKCCSKLSFKRDIFNEGFAPNRSLWKLTTAVSSTDSSTSARVRPPEKELRRPDTSEFLLKVRGLKLKHQIGYIL